MTIDELIHGWWGTAFPHRPFPKEGGTLQDISLAIRYQLALDGYEKHGIEPSEKFLVNHEAATTFTVEDFSPGSREIYRCEKLGNQQQYFIHPKTGDDIMAIRKSSDIPATVPANTTPATKTAAIVKPTKIGKTAPAEKAPKAEKAPRALGATGFVCGLLTQRKYTDDQIVKLTLDEYPDRTEKQIKVYVSVQRAEINAGRKAGHVVTTPIDRLVEYNGKVVTYASVPKASETRKAASDKSALKRHTSIDPDAEPDTAAEPVTKKTAKKVTKKLA